MIKQIKTYNSMLINQVNIKTCSSRINFKKKKSVLRDGILLYIPIVMFFLAVTVPAPAQTDSLAKYLEIALQNNPLVNQKMYEYMAMKQKVDQAGSLPDPELSAGFFIKPMEIIGGNQVADLRLMQMFPWFGVLKSAREEMTLMAGAGYESYMDTRLQLAYDVQRTWYELFKARQKIVLSGRNRELLKSIEKMALVKYQSAPVTATGNRPAGNPGMAGGDDNSGEMGTTGMITMQQTAMGTGPALTTLGDIYSIQIESAELDNLIEGLKDMEQTISARFNSYLNRSPRTPVFTPDSLNPDTLGISLLSITDSVFNNNPMLRMLDYESRSAEAKKKMTRGMGYPMLGLGLDYSVIAVNPMSGSAMNGHDMLMPMISLSLPVYRKKYSAMQAEAGFTLAAKSSQYESVMNAIKTEFYSAWQQYLDAKRRLNLYRLQSRLAARTLDISIKSFSASNASLTDLLRIRQQAFDYELKESEAIADLNSSIALLKRLMVNEN